ncbi:MAG: undecaprenyl/decaprenyl-phosphate alpha-N-acetylglucosaminyl 1-phosphate transferase [Pirellulaceae bacterium]|nr:undecaprenyl/decaprenyl-phosphate alpha-N-acetylglucosaminyl 1-phosphate transferase [Pirellulaceae bacterium]
MNSLTLTGFVLAATLPSLVMTYLATFFIRRLALYFELVDRPNARKVHTKTTPLGGGVAIWLGVISFFAVAQLGLLLIDIHEGGGVSLLGFSLPDLVGKHYGGLWQQSGKLWVLLIAATLLMLLGLWDDKKGIRWQLRLGLQFFISALCVWLFDWRLTAFIEIPWLTSFLSVLWIVALINSFNMLDNMDGLSGGVALIAATVLATAMLLIDDPAKAAPQLFVSGFLFVFAGSLFGFLLHNRPPASIFMGDAGSYFVGFCIAVATLLATYTGQQSGSSHAVLTPLFVMAVPLYDMLSVIVIRLMQGRSPFEADRYHFSHRLVVLGLSKTQAVFTVYLTSATCGLGALLLHQVNWLGGVIIGLMIFFILSIVAILEVTARKSLHNKKEQK